MGAFDETKVKLIIEAATDAAKKKMQEFTDQTNKGLRDADESAKKFGDGLNEGWKKAKAAWVEIGAAVLAVKKGYDLMNNAARFMEREQAFANMAASHNANAEKIIADLKKISHYTVDTMTIIEKAGTAMTLGIQAEKLDELMAVARASSKITGQTVTEAFSDITMAVGRGSKMILDNLGIIVKVEEANQRYAAKLGKVAEELTEVEKKQAFLNATLEAGEGIIMRVGDEMDSAADKIRQYQARWKDAGNVIGKALLTAAQGSDVALTAAETTYWRIWENLSKLWSYFAEKTKNIPGIGKIAETWERKFKKLEATMKGVREEGIKQMSETWDTMNAMWKKTEPTHKGLIQDLNAQGDAAQKAAEKVSKLMDSHKSEAAKREQAIKTMYDEAGINAEAYYREEVNKLAKQAKSWKEAGVEIEDVNQYLFAAIEKIQEEALKKGAEEQAEWLDTLKWHSSTMIDDLEEKEQDAVAHMKEMGKAIKDIDESEIGVHVQLYDQPFYDGIDKLIARLESLSAASASATAATGSGSSGGTGEVTVSEGGAITNHFHINEQVSRSDVTNIVEEQNRQADRR